jgi:pilus assembly protein CpaD
MKKPFRPTSIVGHVVLPLAVSALLAACSDTEDAKRAALDWVNPDQRPVPVAEAQDLRHDVRFAPGSALLTDSEKLDLLTFFAGTGVDRNDVIVVGRPADGPGINQPRAEAVQSLLRGNGIPATIVVQPRTDGAAVDGETVDRLAVTVRRYRVVLPGCPNWTGDPLTVFDNRPHGNWGCSTAVNLGMMVANPADLVQGRPLGNANAELLSRSITLYRKGMTKDLIRDAAAAETFPVKADSKNPITSDSGTGPGPGTGSAGTGAK